MAKSETDVAITGTWLDLTSVYTELSGQPARVQNKSADFVEVKFSASGTAPSDNSGYRIMAGDGKTDSALHIWVRSESGNAVIACGLEDVASSGSGALASAVTGRKTLTTGAQALASNALTNGVTIKAPKSNSGVVYFGFSAGVSAGTGFDLAPGESASVAVNNTALIYALSTSAGDTLSFMGN